MAEKPHELDDNTRFAMPVRNLISLVVAVALGSMGILWCYRDDLTKLKPKLDFSSVRLNKKYGV